MTEMETPLARVRGLGSAHHGGEEWWAVRMNSVALLGLSVWLLVSLVRLPDLSQTTIVEWLRQPLAAVPMLLLIGTVFWHANKGLREVVDDYAHDEGWRAFWLMALAFACWLGGTFAAFFVLKIALSVGSGG